MKATQSAVISNVLCAPRPGEVLLISQADTLRIIETRTPRELFLLREADGSFTTIDNETGEAWTENFPNQEAAMDITKLPEAEGMEFHFVAFESDASEELQDIYRGVSLTTGWDWTDAVKAWQPTPPEGDGWFLLALYDTDDGPYACFTRPKLESA